MVTSTPEEIAEFCAGQLLAAERRTLLGETDQWGAMVSAAMERLIGLGLLEPDGTRTPLGRAVAEVLVRRRETDHAE